ncbi:lipoprotein [Leptospira alexanderi]|uniref:lipoprotein n=1 Tax=Leptospira alexanderi TaxID=100053 RepID=UPI0009912281|nr:lipoprotein [Leptospira alexanderi]
MLNDHFQILLRTFTAFCFLCFGTCRPSLRYYHDITYNVSFSEMDKTALKGGNRISIVRFLSKSSNQADIISSVFSDNLLFFLHTNGIKGTISNPSAKIEEPQPNSNVSIVTATQKMNSAYLLNSEQVKEICAETNSDYVITGFVHETKAGNFLNPEQSSGIMAYLYNKNGSQVVQMQYIGAESLELYDNSSEVARVFANKIVELLRSK